MKKVLSIITAISILLSSTMVIAANNSVQIISDDEYLSQLSDLISSTEDENYMGSLNLTIGSDTMTLDGEEIKIDNEGSVPVIENDTTLLPIRGVAEAIGAEVEYSAPTQTVSLFNADTEVNMQLGSAEIEINGATQQMPVAAKIVNDRTLIPLRAATEALGCDVSWDGTNQTIMLTRPYQTKRVVVHSENADTSNASDVINGNGMTVMQFDTEEQARESVIINENNGFIAEPDYVYKLESLSWGTDRINAPTYYNSYVAKQSDLTVAVIDSGLDSSHSCFRNKVVSGYDFVHNDNIPDDENGHGTHVASTIADVADSITQSNAMVRGSASYSGSRPSEVGLYLGTSADNMSKVARDSINHSKNPFDVWYDLNSEAGQHLSPATTYYYKIYGIQNGIEVCGEVKSFTTSPKDTKNTYTAYVVNTDGSLAINSIPKKGNQIGVIPEGAACTVYSDRTSGNWYWVEYNGISGYSYKDYLSANPNSNTRTGIIRGTDGHLVINSIPKKGNQVGLIPEGASCTVYMDKILRQLVLGRI